MPVPARLKSILRSLREGVTNIRGKDPCQVIHACTCGEPLIFLMIHPEVGNFGHMKGLDLKFTWIPAKYKIKPGVLPLFRRVPLAGGEHLEFKCPRCGQLSEVQKARDGGILPLGPASFAYVILPPEKKDILHAETASRRIAPFVNDRHG